MIERISTYIVVSIFFVGISHLLKSAFLSDFLMGNIVLVIITLLAINTATYGFIISKIDDMSQGENNGFFDEAVVEIKKSLKYQLILIACSILVSILASSKVVTDSFNHSKEVFDFLLMFIFVFALDLLRDTGFAIFELRTPKKKDGEEQE